MHEKHLILIVLFPFILRILGLSIYYSLNTLAITLDRLSLVKTSLGEANIFYKCEGLHAYYVE